MKPTFKLAPAEQQSPAKPSFIMTLPGFQCTIRGIPGTAYAFTPMQILRAREAGYKLQTICIPTPADELTAVGRGVYSRPTNAHVDYAYHTGALSEAAFKLHYGLAV